MCRYLSDQNRLGVVSEETRVQELLPDGPDVIIHFAL